MVILLSALSVVAAAVLLGAWFLVGGGFGLIYAAMALAAASMALLWAARWLGSTPDAAVADRPVDLPALVSDTARDAAATRDLVGVSAGRPEPAALDASVGSDEAHRTVGPAQPAEAASGPADGDLDESVAEDGPAFPIADYDTLWLSQILPLLDQLDDTELAMVDARERGGRHRVAVLEAIAARRPDAGDGGAGPAARPEPGAWEQGPAAGPVAPLSDLDLDEPLPVAAGEAGDAHAVEELGEPAGAAGPPAGPAGAGADPGPLAGDPFGLLDPADQAEEDRLWAAAVPLLDQGRDPFLDDDDEPVPAATVEALAAVDADDWDVAEPDRWDWSGVRPEPAPIRTVEAVDLGADPDLVFLDDAPSHDGSPRVRTFLGRRRSPVTVRRG